MTAAYVEAADATDAAARLWRDAEPVLRAELPDPFTVADIRKILAAHGLIANDGTDRLQCLGAWGRKLGARTTGLARVTAYPGAHPSFKAQWTFTNPHPEAPMGYAEDARAILGDKGELVRALAAQTLRLETARAALRQIADHADPELSAFARSQWALTDPHRRQSA